MADEIKEEEKVEATAAEEKAEESTQEADAATESKAAAEPTADEKIAAAEAQVAAANDKWMRLAAEYDNYRKRVAREREELMRHAKESVVKDFLPVADHIALALAKAPKNESTAAFVEGVELVRKQFLEALAKHEMVPIEAKGTKFNPVEHEALTQQPSETVPEGEVIEQFRCGWKLGAYVLRPAQVVVSSGKPATA